jgi:hypothetical protein
MSNNVKVLSGTEQRPRVVNEAIRLVQAGINSLVDAGINRLLSAISVAVGAGTSITIDASENVTFAENVGIGSVTTPTALLQINGNGVTSGPAGGAHVLVYCDDTTTQASITSLSAGITGGGTFHANHARGTLASPTASQAGDITGGIGSRIYDGTSWLASSPASIHWVQTDNATSSAHGMGLRFLTTPKSSTTRKQRVVITDNGRLIVHDDAGNFVDRTTAHTAPITGVENLLTVIGDGSNVCAMVMAFSQSSTGYRGLTAGGTYTSPSATSADNYLVFLAGHGYNGTTLDLGSKGLFGIKAAETWGSSANGTYAVVETTPIGSTTRAERVRVTDALTSATTPIQACSGTAIPAGGTAGAGLRVSSTSNFGVFFGSGAPSLSAAKGSLYLRSDGSSSTTRLYVNTDGSTAWTSVVTST